MHFEFLFALLLLRTLHFMLRVLEKERRAIMAYSRGSSSRGAMADKESPEEIETLKTKGTHEGMDRKLN